MKKLLALLFLLQISFFSFSQVKGNNVCLESDCWCGSFIYFTSDSVAWYLTGCESTQLFTKLNYKIGSKGDLSFNKVPDSLYQPLLGLTKGEIVFEPYDSLFKLPKLVFMDKGRAWTESVWRLSGDTLENQWGSMLSTIPDRFFSDSTLKIRFIEFDRLKDSLPEIDYTDFKGDGTRFIVHADFPPCFFIYSHMSYRSDLCDLSKLKFKVINGKLHEWKDKHWVAVKE